MHTAGVLRPDSGGSDTLGSGEADADEEQLRIALQRSLSEQHCNPIPSAPSASAIAAEEEDKLLQQALLASMTESKPATNDELRRAIAESTAVDEDFLRAIAESNADDDELSRALAASMQEASLVALPAIGTADGVFPSLACSDRDHQTSQPTIHLAPQHTPGLTSHYALHLPRACAHGVPVLCLPFRLGGAQGNRNN